MTLKDLFYAYAIKSFYIDVVGLLLLAVLVYLLLPKEKPND